MQYIVLDPYSKFPVSASCGLLFLRFRPSARILDLQMYTSHVSMDPWNSSFRSILKGFMMVAY